MGDQYGRYGPPRVGQRTADLPLDPTVEADAATARSLEKIASWSPFVKATPVLLFIIAVLLLLRVMGVGP
jgi:hypothetical protein